MFFQRPRMIAFVIALGIILASASGSTNSVDLPILSGNTPQLSSVVWSDDFENVTKTLSEWTIDGQYTPNVTLSDGLLYSDGPGLNVITHNSTTATGTWSLDLFLGEQDDYWIWIVFMSPYWPDNHQTPEGYAFVVMNSGPTTHFFGLAYIVPDPAGAGPSFIDTVDFNVASGWQHLDFTRQSDRLMSVFLNGSLILLGTDNRMSSSEYYRLHSDHFAIFDNVTVSDTVDLDGVPPHWTEPLINHTINYGEDFSHALSADDYSGLDTWRVDNAELFEISDEGVVTSRAIMPAGTFGVEVNVNDTFGNVLSGTFNVEVLPLPTNTTTSPTTPTGPNPLNPLTITLFGAVGVVWFIVVLFILRDYRDRRPAQG